MFTVFLFAIIPKLPNKVSKFLFNTIASICFIMQIKGIKIYKRNIKKLCPNLNEKEVSKISKEMIRNYFGYFLEIICYEKINKNAKSENFKDLPIDIVDSEKIEQWTKGGRSVIAALGHNGNWDIAGAFASRKFAPVLTVAEHLKPQKLFNDFVQARNALGIQIIAHDSGGVFDQLYTKITTEKKPYFVPLIADRDIKKGRGIPVCMENLNISLKEQKIMVAPGPAALALKANLPLFPVHIFVNKNDVNKNDFNKKKYTAICLPAVYDPTTASAKKLQELYKNPQTKKQAIEILTNKWAVALFNEIQKHPESWFMMQEVFV